jgi:hypothetical protein
MAVTLAEDASKTDPPIVSTWSVRLLGERLPPRGARGVSLVLSWLQKTHD